MLVAGLPCSDEPVVSWRFKASERTLLVLGAAGFTRPSPKSNVGRALELVRLLPAALFAELVGAMASLGIIVLPALPSAAAGLAAPPKRYSFSYWVNGFSKEVPSPAGVASPSSPSGSTGLPGLIWLVTASASPDTPEPSISASKLPISESLARSSGVKFEAGLMVVTG